MDKRVKIISQRANITESKARDLIQKQDKQRACLLYTSMPESWCRMCHRSKGVAKERLKLMIDSRRKQLDDETMAQDVYKRQV